MPLYFPGERAFGIHCVGGWVGPRTGLNDVEKLNLALLGTILRSRYNSVYRE
jgi:hypothetical protein